MSDVYPWEIGYPVTAERNSGVLHGSLALGAADALFGQCHYRQPVKVDFNDSRANKQNNSQYIPA